MHPERKMKIILVWISNFNENLCMKFINFTETISQYNDEDFVMHFRLNRQRAISLSEQYENSETHKPQTGQYGKLSAFNQVCQ